MYKINDNYKNYIENNTSMSPKSKIVVDGIEYAGNVIKTVPKISHKNEKMFGGFPTKTCSFEIYDLDNTLNFENKEIIVYRGLVINGEIEYIPQGVFIPQADKITTNISQRTITFQNIEDKTQFFDTKYNSKLDWTTTHTGLEIVQEICDNLNIKLENNNFNFSDYNFKRPNFIENISNREVISRLAEIGGSIAFINRNGNLEIKEQTPTGHTIQRKRYGKLSRENQYGIINTIVLGKEGIDDDIVYPDPNMENKVDWKIHDNPYVDLYREEMIEEVSKYIIGKSIIPFELTDFVDGNYLDLNDTITIIDRNGEEFTGVILNYENNSRIKSTIGANTQDTTLTNYKLAGSQKQSIGGVKLQVDHINELVQSTVTLVNDQNEKISQVTQTVEELNSKIQNIVDLTTTVEGIGTIGIDRIMTSELLFLHIYPTKTDLSYLYPSKNLFPSEDLFMTTRDLVATKIDSETGEDVEVLRYTLPCDLHYIDGNIKDEFVIDYENKQMYCIHRVGFNEDGDKVPLEEEQKEYFVYSGIQFEEGTYKLFMESFEDAYINVRYSKQNEFTSQFATHVDLSTSITLLRNQIELKVSEKLDKDEIIASLNLAVENDLGIIELKGNHVIIDSDNFKLDKLGNINANNATLHEVNVEGGNINLYDTGGSSASPTITIANEKDSAFNTRISSYGLTNNYRYIGGTFKSRIGSFESEYSLTNRQYGEPDAVFKFSPIYLTYAIGDEETGDVLFSWNTQNINAKQFLIADTPTASNNVVRLRDYQSWVCDKRYKKNIKDSEYQALNKILSINHKEFDYKYGGHVENGYVADELEEIDKSFIYESGEDKIKHPQLSSIIPAITKAIQEQQTIINKLEKRILVIEKGI